MLSLKAILIITFLALASLVAANAEAQVPDRDDTNGMSHLFQDDGNNVKRQDAAPTPAPTSLPNLGGIDLSGIDLSGINIASIMSAYPELVSMGLKAALGGAQRASDSGSGGSTSGAGSATTSAPTASMTADALSSAQAPTISLSVKSVALAVVVALGGILKK